MPVVPKVAGEMDTSAMGLRARGASFADLHTSSISTLLGEAPMIEYEFQAWKADLVSAGVVDKPARWLDEGHCSSTTSTSRYPALGGPERRNGYRGAEDEAALPAAAVRPGHRRNHAMCKASVTTLACGCAFILQNRTSTAVTDQYQVMFFKGLQT